MPKWDAGQPTLRSVISVCTKTDYYSPMQNNRERWEKLCEKASDERDPKKREELVIEIDRLLAEEQDRLNHLPPIKP